MALNSAENSASKILTSYVDDLDKNNKSDSKITKASNDEGDVVFEGLSSGKTRDETSSSKSSNGSEDLMFSGLRCLLVEDNALNAEIAIELLSMQGIEVDRATNGKEALDIMTNIDDWYYDIIFMDIQMPLMNGFESTQSIRNLPSDYAKKVPIIAMSANAYADDVRHSIDVGMNAHISKPIDLTVLYATVAKHVIEK
jgi:CheY-like chemotaxis protein